jgi:hypothetical protein
MELNLLQVVCIPTGKEGYFCDTPDNRVKISEYIWRNYLDDPDYALDNGIINLALNEQCECEEHLIRAFQIYHRKLRIDDDETFHKYFHESKICEEALICESCASILIHNCWYDNNYHHPEWIFGCIDEWALNTDAVVCQSCTDQDDVFFSVLCIEKDEHESGAFGKYSARFTDDYYPSSKELGEFCRGIKSDYVHTDGWRGYNDVQWDEEKYSRLSCGWTTDWADEYHHSKDDFNDFIESLAERSEKGEGPKFPIFVIAAQTSNCLSTAIDVCVKSEDWDKALEFFEKEGFGIERLDSCLG